VAKFFQAYFDRIFIHILSTFVNKPVTIVNPHNVLIINGLGLGYLGEWLSMKSYPQSLEMWNFCCNFRERRAGYAFPPILYGFEIDLVISGIFRIFV
jgi:hypothetical protein